LQTLYANTAEAKDLGNQTKGILVFPNIVKGGFLIAAQYQHYNADRAEARVNLGAFYGNRGDAARAEEEIKAALRLEPLFIPAYVNLADLYRARGRDADGERALREGLKLAPKSAILHHVLGLALVRMKRSDEALGELERATTLEPGNARFAYVYAVALHSTAKPMQRLQGLKKRLWPIPTTAIFSKL
jgi:tetratricopeptide (TPR) repeat protein